MPSEINLHKTIVKILDLRKQSVLEKKGIDWGTAEALAFGSLLRRRISSKISRARFW